MWHFAAFLHLSLHQTGYIWVTKRQQVAALIGSVTVVTVDIWLPLMNHKRLSWPCRSTQHGAGVWVSGPTDAVIRRGESPADITGNRRQDNDSFSGWCSDNYISIKLIDLQHPDSDVCGRCSRFFLLQIILLSEYPQCRRSAGFYCSNKAGTGVVLFSTQSSSDTEDDLADQ